MTAWLRDRCLLLASLVLLAACAGGLPAVGPGRSATAAAAMSALLAGDAAAAERALDRPAGARRPVDDLFLIALLSWEHGQDDRALDATLTLLESAARQPGRGMAGAAGGGGGRPVAGAAGVVPRSTALGRSAAGAQRASGGCAVAALAGRAGCGGCAGCHCPPAWRRRPAGRVAGADRLPDGGATGGQRRAVAPPGSAGRISGIIECGTLKGSHTPRDGLRRAKPACARRVCRGHPGTAG